MRTRLPGVGSIPLALKVLDQCTGRDPRATVDGIATVPGGVGFVPQSF